MTDTDALVRELLEEQVPLRFDTEPEWDDVVRRAAEREPRRLQRRVVLVAVAAGALLVTGVAIAAAVGGIPWWEGAPPPARPEFVEQYLGPRGGLGPEMPPPDLSRARTVARDNGAALVAAPEGTGDGYCLVPSLADGPSFGSSCDEAGDNVQVYARPDLGWEPHWIVFGRFTEPGAATLDLPGPPGVRYRIQLRPGGFFMADVPQKDWNELNYRRGEARLLDADGRTILTGCANWGPGPRDPLVAGSSNGIGRLPFFWHGFGVHCLLPWQLDVEHATKLVELKLLDGTPNGDMRGGTEAVWRAPQSDGTLCIMYAHASPKLAPPRTPAPAASRGNQPFGLVCEPDIPTADPIAVSIGGGQDSGADAYWTFEGHVAPEVTRLELEARGATRFAFANGWFLGELPTTNSIHEFPSGGQYFLVGYDRSGKEVARVNLEETWRAER